MDQVKQVKDTLARNAQITKLEVLGQSTLAIQVVGDMTATLAFEGTVDGTNWFALNAVPKDSATAVTSATAAGVWFANVAGLLAARVRCTAYTTGSPTIALQSIPEGSPAAAGTYASSVVADGANVVEGATTDAAVVTDTTGTISGKLRGLVKIFADVWDSSNKWLNVNLASPLYNTKDKITAYHATDALMNGLTELTPKRAIANIAASQTAASVVSTVTGKKIRVTSVVAQCGATATTVVFNSASTAISPTFQNGANGGEVLPDNPRGWFETVAGEALTVTTGAGSTTGILVNYVEV